MKVGSLPKIMGSWTHFYFGSWRLQATLCRVNSKCCKRSLDVSQALGFSRSLDTRISLCVPRGNSPRLICWVWVKMKPPGIGPLVFVHVSIYQRNPVWIPIFDPQLNRFVFHASFWRRIFCLGPLHALCGFLRKRFESHWASGV